MKVPAECPGEQSKEERKKLKAERQEAANAGLKKPTDTAHLNSSAAELPALERSTTMNSLSSGYAASANRSIAGGPPRSPVEESAPVIAAPGTSAPAPRRNRVIAPPPVAYISELPGNTVSNGSGRSEPRGKMMYSYEANGPGELSVSEGKTITIVEPNGKTIPMTLSTTLTLQTDGSGWMKVQSGSNSGLVPASYVEATISAPSPEPVRPASTYSNSGSSIANSIKKKGPAVAPRRGAKKLKYVEALYDYTAQSDAEHSIQEGDRVVLIKEDPGDGWAEVEIGGRVGSVPAAYVQAV